MKSIHFIKNATEFNAIEFKDAYVVRLSGSQSPNAESVYNQLRHCLDFPEYFGNNLDALYDCLTDLEWIQQTHIILFIDQFDNFLSEEIQDNFKESFFLCLYDACLSWRHAAISNADPKTISIYISWTKKAELLLQSLSIPYNNEFNGSL